MVLSTQYNLLSLSEHNASVQIEPSSSSTNPTERLTQSAEVAFDEGFAFGSEAHDFGYATTRDGDSTYITGKYTGSMDVGTFSLTSNGPSDVFVMRITNEGIVDWLVGFGGSSDDAGFDIEFSNGKLWVVGYFDEDISTTMYNGASFYEDLHERALFISSLDSTNGDLMKIDILDGYGEDVASGLTRVGEDFRIAGHTSSDGDLTQHQSNVSSSLVGDISNAGGADILTLHYDVSEGDFPIINSTGGTGDDRASDISVIGNPSTSTNVAVVGHFGSTVGFDGDQLTASGLGSAGFVASQSDTGSWNWAAAASGEMNVQLMGVDSDDSENIYITGEFAGETKLFNEGASSASHTLNSEGFSDVLVARLSPGGDWGSAKAMGGPFNDLGISIAVDEHHDLVYVAGLFHDKIKFPKGSTSATAENLSGYGNVDGFIAAFTDTSLDGVWISDVGGPGRDATMDVAVSEEGRVFMTGYVTGEANAGSIKLEGKPDYQDVYYADINPYLPMPSPGYVEVIGEGITIEGTLIEELTSIANSDKVYSIIEIDIEGKSVGDGDLVTTITDTNSTWAQPAMSTNSAYSQMVVATEGNELLWVTTLNATMANITTRTNCGDLINLASNGNIVLGCRVGELYISENKIIENESSGALGIVVLDGDTGAYDHSYILEKFTTNASTTPKSISIEGDKVLISGTCSGQFTLASSTKDCGTNSAFVALSATTVSGQHGPSFDSMLVDSSYTSFSEVTWTGDDGSAAIGAMSPDNRNISFCKIMTNPLDSAINSCKTVSGQGPGTPRFYLEDMQWNEENSLVIGARFTGEYDFGINQRQESIEISNPSTMNENLVIASLIDADVGTYQIDWAGSAASNQPGLSLIGMALTEESVIVNGHYNGELTFGTTTLTTPNTVDAGFVATISGYGNWVSANKSTAVLGKMGSVATYSSGDASYWSADISSSKYDLVKYSSGFYDPEIGTSRVIQIHYNTDFSITPQTKGPEVSFWTIDGDLPTGLSFNTSTGEISGRSAIDPADPNSCTTPILKAHSNVIGVTRNSYYGMPVKICITYSDVTNFAYTNPIHYAKYGHTVSIPAPTYDGGPVTGFSSDAPNSFYINHADGSYGGVVDSSFTSLPVPTKALLFTQALTGPNAAGATAGVEIIVDANPVLSIAPTWTISTQFTNHLEIPVDEGGAIVENFALIGSDIPSAMSINPTNGTITWLNVPILTESPQQITVNASNALGSTEVTIDLVYIAPTLSFEYQPDEITVFTGQHVDSTAPTFEHGFSNEFSIEPDASVIPGLEFNNKTGRISGEPETVTTDPITFTVSATHTYHHPTQGNQTTSGQATFTVNAIPPAPKFDHIDTEVQAVVDHVFSKTYHSSQGEVTKWSITPELPPGVYFNTSSGEIYGTGQAPGVTSHTIRGSNIDGSDSFTFRLHIIEPGPNEIHYPVNNLSLISGLDMQPFAPIAFQGQPDWSVSPQSPLPTGLSIDATTGVITGHPTMKGITESEIIATANGKSVSYNLSFSVLDLPITERQVEQASYTLKVKPPAPKFDHVDTEVQAVVGHAFSKIYHSSQGEVTTWSLTPELPTGVYFNPTSGEIYGTGSTVGESTHSIVATNIEGSASFLFRLVFIEKSPGEIHYPINNLSLLIGQEMQPFSPLSSEGNAVWSVETTHPLPAGLTIDSTTGVISGQPTTTGVSKVGVKAVGTESTVTYNLTIVVNDLPKPEKIIQVVNRTVEHTVFETTPNPSPCDCDNQGGSTTVVDGTTPSDDQTSSKNKSEALPILSGVIVALIIGTVLGRITHPMSGNEPNNNKKHEGFENKEEE